MWFLDGRAVTDVIAAGRLEPIPYEEWLRLDSPLDGAGLAAEQLRETLGLPAGDTAPPEPRPES